MNITLYNILVASVLSYIWQFAPPPSDIRRMESVAFDRIFLFFFMQ